MKINLEFINKIFNRKLKIVKKSDKIKISNYDEHIPMYDIYSEKIYLIGKKNLYERLIYSHYRFINDEVKNWIENKLKKSKSNPKFKKLYENSMINLEIISNYDLETLYNTSIRTLFSVSPNLGLKISICKRNSFDKHYLHKKPYYSRDELIKLGLNMDVLKEKDLDKIDILDPKIHYKICKQISNNDVSYQEILNHTKFIIENKLISHISFYSFMGSYFMNNLLRTENNPEKSNFYFKMTQYISSKILDSPNIEKEYFIYRFIWDDYFIRNLKIGEVFEDKGFLSTTRDPFYSPNNEIKFGVVLAKIKIKPNISKCLLIENFSLFPKEEEILLIPNSRLKLISKNENFKYYHVNESYEKNITKKYEFELIGNNYSESIDKVNVNQSKDQYDDDFIQLDNELFVIQNKSYNDKIEIINNFIRKYGLNTDKIKFDNYMKIRYKNSNENIPKKNYKIFYHWFDGTDSYELFYKNKNKDGMFFIIYDDNNYPYINIEFGDKMIINNLNKFYYYDKKNKIDITDFLFIVELARIFKYPKFEINGEYENFSEFVGESVDSYKVASYSNLYCKSFYEYLKNGKVFYQNIIDNKIFINFKELFDFKYGYFKIDKLKDMKIPNELLNKFEDKSIKSNNVKDFIIEIIENHYLFYHKLKSYFSEIFNSLSIDFDVQSYFRNANRDLSVFEDLPYSSYFVEEDDNYKLVFRRPVKRVI